MRNVLTILALLFVGAAPTSGASEFVAQSEVPTNMVSITEVRRDAAGNVFLLGRHDGVETYGVSVYSHPDFQLLFSFDTGITTPLAFDVAGDGQVYVAGDAYRVPTGTTPPPGTPSGLHPPFELGIVFRKFTNAGALIKVANLPANWIYGYDEYCSSPASTNCVFLDSAAIDADADMVLAAWQRWSAPYCLGSCPPNVTAGFSSEGHVYNSQGERIGGISFGWATHSGVCQRAATTAFGSDGNVYRWDPDCGKIFKHDPADSSEIGQWPASDVRRMWSEGSEFLYSIEGGRLRKRTLVGEPVLLSLPEYAGGVDWDDRLVYAVSTRVPANLLRLISNRAPTAPVITSPLGAVVQHPDRANLVWSASADPDGDFIRYEVLLGTDPASMPLAGSVESAGFTTAPLEFGTTYYWRIRSFDSYRGFRLQTTPSGTLPFNINLVNAPPGAFSVRGGTGTVSTRLRHTGLAWSVAVDPDGDVVRYEVSVGTDSTTLAVVQDSTATLYDLPIDFGATYYWKVRARDGFGGMRMLPIQKFLAQFQNTAPPPPAILAGAGESAQHTYAPNAELEWASVLDPEGDAVAYRLEFGSSPEALSVVQDGAETDYAVASADQGSTSYWRVTAYDAHGAHSSTEIQELRLVLRNEAPRPFAASAGAGSLATRTTRTALSWTSAGDPDGDVVQYELFVSTDAASPVSVQISSSRIFTLDFEYDRLYYWSVIARDGFGGETLLPLQIFAPTFANAPPSVPENLTLKGTVALHAQSTALSFFWEPSIDPDGDPLTYAVEFGTSPETLADHGSFGLGGEIAGLAPGRAYYYRIVATDIYGAASVSPLEWVFFEFANADPEPFSIVGGSGTYSTRRDSALLSWTAAEDEDGDAVRYRVHVGSAPETLSLLVETISTAVPLPAMAFGTTYYWSVSAHDGLGGSRMISDGPFALRHLFANTPPSRPNVASAVGPLAYHANAATHTLIWSASADPDGDDFIYELAVGTNPLFLENVHLPPGSEKYESGPLQDGVTYYYSLSARDVYGLRSAQEQGSFYKFFVNTAPAPFSMLSATGTVATRSSETTLRWSAAADADGDAISYRVETAGLAPAVAVDGRSARLAGLEFGRTYTLRVCASDEFGAVTCTDWASLHWEFQNAAPQFAERLFPQGEISLRTTSPAALLSWEGPADPDGDAVAFDVHFGTAPEAMKLAAQLSTASFLADGLAFATTYFWRVDTRDPYATTRGETNIFWLSLDNAAPRAISYLSPESVRTRASSFTLRWADSGDPDGEPVVYDLRLGNSPGGMAPVVLASSTAFDLSFAYGATYYYQVAARDSFGALSEGEIRRFSATFLSDPPEPVDIAAPFMEQPLVRTMNGVVEMSWPVVSNPQGDPIAYTVHLGESPNALPALLVIDADAQGDGGVRVAEVLDPRGIRSLIEMSEGRVKLRLEGLRYFQTYYLRIAASNPFGSASETGIQSFSLSALEGFDPAYAYPVPFNPLREGTNIVLNAPPGGYGAARVGIYSEFGDLLYERELKNVPAGISEFHYDGRDRFGRALFNGTYLVRVRFEAPAAEHTFRIAVVK